MKQPDRPRNALRALRARPDLPALVARCASLCLLAIALSSCAGAAIRPLFGMRDVGVSREQAARLVRIALVAVEVRPATLASARGSRWEDLALLNDDRLREVLDQVARQMNAAGVHRVRVADRAIVVLATPKEPQVMVDGWVKSDDANPDGQAPADADALLEVAWAAFTPPIRHVEVGLRLVDPGSGRILGRAIRLIVDSPSVPPKLEHGRDAVEAGARGIGLVTAR